jgi:hypothetical protein
MTNWYSSIYKALIMASVVAFAIGFFSQRDVSLGATLAGYSVLILAVMMILLILFQNVIKVTSGQSSFNVILTIITTSGPFLLMLGVIGFILYLIINYKTIIIGNHVSPSYYTFSNIAIILFLIQIYFVYTNIDSEKFIATGKMSKITSSLIYLLGVLTCVCSLILFTVLKYYTTDGFTPFI